MWADVKDLEEESKDADNDLEEEIDEAESEELVAAEGVQESLANKVEKDKTRIVYLLNFIGPSLLALYYTVVLTLESLTVW